MAGSGSKIDGLTEKQRAFVEAYAGNAEEAAIVAGYSVSFAKAKACHFLRNPAIVEAIKARKPTKAARDRIATREERQAWWTSVLRGEVKETEVTDDGQVIEVPPSLRDRLKASELLGRSEADFTDRVQHGADASFADILKAARERSARR